MNIIKQSFFFKAKTIFVKIRERFFTKWCWCTFLFSLRRHQWEKIFIPTYEWMNLGKNEWISWGCFSFYFYSYKRKSLHYYYYYPFCFVLFDCVLVFIKLVRQNDRFFNECTDSTLSDFLKYFYVWEIDYVNEAISFLSWKRSARWKILKEEN